MEKTPQKHRTPEEEELELKKKELRTLEEEYVEKELTLATLRAELHHFEIRYMKQVGYLYAILDDLEAQIAEEIADQNPRNEHVRHEANQARSKAQKSASESTHIEKVQVSGDKFKPSKTLKDLYKAAAKAIHPDFAENDDERERCHKVMALVNEAYEKGDENRLRSILEEWEASPESVKGEGTAAKLIRIIRRISLIRKRLDNIKEEIEQLVNSSLAGLKKNIDEGLTNGRDLLKEMATQIQSEIEEAKVRLAQLHQSKT